MRSHVSASQAVEKKERKKTPGVGVVMQYIKLPSVMPASHTPACWLGVPVAPLLLLANVPGKAMENGPTA